MNDTSKVITYDVWMGDFRVIQVKDNAITMSLGNNITITLHCATKTEVKTGDKLPLFTRIPLDANARLSYILTGSETPPDR